MRGRVGAIMLVAVVLDIDDARLDEKGDEGDVISGVADGSWCRVIPGVCCRFNFGVAEFAAAFGVYVCAGNSAKETSLVCVVVFVSWNDTFVFLPRGGARRRPR